MISQLRRWQLAQARAHEHVHRCFEMRRTFEGGTSVVSLRELSLEVARQSQNVLQLHQALRGQFGCVSATM